MPDLSIPTGIPTGLWYQTAPDVRVHQTAILEQGVVIGRGTSIWDSVHIRRDAVIGEECIIGEKTYVAYEVRIGNRCKINSCVYIYAAVVIGDGVMIAAGTVFTNDRFPRATTPDLKQLRPSNLDEATPTTHVHDGATIGANCTIGMGKRIGKWAMVGMGSIVTKDVPDFALAVGSPAKVVGAVCRCGQMLVRHEPGQPPKAQRFTCTACERQYDYDRGVTSEVQ